MAAIKISEGFNLGYCRALPGKGPMLHNHDTNETFIAMTGTWRASWENEKGKLEHVDLKPLDVISFPPGANRRFMNVTKGPKNKHSILMFVIGGNEPERGVHRRVDGRARARRHLAGEGGEVTQAKPSAGSASGSSHSCARTAPGFALGAAAGHANSPSTAVHAAARLPSS